MSKHKKYGKWYIAEEKDPPSDSYVLVILTNKCFALSYYFEDSFGKWYSPAKDIWSKTYTGYVSHWRKLPKVIIGDNKERIRVAT